MDQARITVGCITIPLPPVHSVELYIFPGMSLRKRKQTAQRVNTVYSKYDIRAEQRLNQLQESRDNIAIIGVVHLPGSFYNEHRPNLHRVLNFTAQLGKFEDITWEQWSEETTDANWIAAKRELAVVDPHRDALWRQVRVHLKISPSTQEM